MVKCNWCFMRVRNIKNKDEILNNCEYVIKNPQDNRGKWQKVFSNKNPIYLEIGMGKGQFIINSALSNPNINYIGIEKSGSVLVQATRKIETIIPNLRFINADAKDIVDIFDKEISLIYLNFSDPWPKKRHAKRRLTSVNFLEKYDNICKGEKIIEMKTDNQLLFEYSLESFSNYGYIIKEISLDLLNSSINDVKTEYEEKFENKCKINYVKVVKYD